MIYALSLQSSASTANVTKFDTDFPSQEVFQLEILGIGFGNGHSVKQWMLRHSVNRPFPNDVIACLRSTSFH